MVRILPSDKTYLLRGLVKNAFINGKIIELNSYNIEAFIKTAEINAPATVLEKRDRLLQYYNSLSDYYGHLLDITENDLGVAYCKNQIEFDRLVQFLYSAAFFSGKPAPFLTIDAYNYLEDLKKTVDSKQCFVAMNFDDNLESLYKNSIQSAIEDSQKYKAYRVDKVAHNDLINNKIIAEIRKSKFLVAEFTGQKRGVYFEAGFAMGLGKPVIFLVKKTDLKKLHFDTRQYNHIVWETEKELFTKLKDQIEATIF